MPGYEGDVTPRPNGNNNGTVTITDWAQAGRFAAGLDVTAAGAEFQRADCAPRDTKGDGRLTVADWTQAGRYLGTDPTVAAGGPTQPVSSNQFAAGGAALHINSRFAAEGRVGLPVGQALPAGARQIVLARFQALPGRGHKAVGAIEFGDLPVRRALVDAEANALPVSFVKPARK